MDLKNIGKKIKERRKILGINQDDLCEIAEISQHTLSDIENGRGNPSLYNFTKILDALGMELDVIVSEVE
jgi:transcriptional regulator with XRE-family HTH domain